MNASEYGRRLGAKYVSLRKKEIDVYRVLNLFLCFGFFGWIFETLYVFVSTGKRTVRGLVFVREHAFSLVPALSDLPLVWGMPIIVIFGLGGIVMIITLQDAKPTFFSQFIAGALIVTAFELMASYFCDIALHRTCWTYKYELIHFQGRISLRSAISWGFISILCYRFLFPWADRVYLLTRSLRGYRRTMHALVLFSAVCVCLKYFV